MMDFSLIRWELAVAFVAFAVFLADLFIPKLSAKTLGLGAASLLGFFLFWSLYATSGIPEVQGQPVRIFTASGLYVMDPLALWTKQFAMLSTALILLLTVRCMASSTYLAETIVVELMACLAVMLAGSVADFFFLFVAMEFLTVCFYVLVSLERSRVRGMEAALKYLVYGALSSGIMLYGITLIAGVSGQSHFMDVRQFALTNHNNNLLDLGLVLLLVGLAFKISAVPFHWWTPDVYEGAPTPVVAFLSIISKGAGVILLVRVLFEAFPPYYRTFWVPILGIAAGLSMLLGALGGISQGNLKRLMGYSSISHSGFILLGIATASGTGLSATLYYLVGYLLANILIFYVMCEMEAGTTRHDIRDYTGLGFQSPWKAGAMLLGLLSLGGIPPLAGFTGKLLVLYSALEHGGKFLVLLIAAISAALCSLYYYLVVVRTMYLVPPVVQSNPLRLSISTKWIFGLLCFAVLAVGFYPSPWWQNAARAIRQLLT